MGKDRSWWVVLIEGIVAIGLALYIFLATESAVRNIGLVVALYLLAVGLINAIGGFMGTHGSKSIMYQGIVGLIVGGILAAMFFFNWGTITLGYTILGLGMIVYGGLGIWAYFFDRGKKDFQWGPILISAALVVWGVMIFIARGQGFDLATVSAWILLAIGALAVGWSFYLRSRTAAAGA